MRRALPLLLTLLIAATPARAQTYPDKPPPEADGSSLVHVADNLADPSLFSVDPLVLQLYGTGGHGTRFGPRGATMTTGYPDTYRPALKRVPWADPGRDVWAPTVYRFTSRKGTGYGMYFTAPRADTGQHCLGTAKAAAANGPFRPTKKLWCAPGDLEAIDPTVVDANGLRYVVFKTSDHNRAPFTISALPMLGRNGLTFSPQAPTTILSGSTMMENPSFVAHAGTVWMFLSRASFSTCDYYTDAWSSATFPGTFVARRRITSRRLTRQAQGRPGGPGLCGPGGAAVSPDPIGGVYRIVLHAYHKVTDPRAGDRRDAYLGSLLFDAAGVPYVD